MFKYFTHKIVNFSVKHPWIIIGIASIITILFALPLQRLQIESDVESLLPKELTEGIGQENIEIYDKLLIMVSGDNLFSVDSLQNFQNSYSKLQSILPVKKIIDPFSFTTLEKIGSRLTAVPLSPGGTAPENIEDLLIFKNRLSKSNFITGFLSSKNKDALVVLILLEKTNNYKSMMQEINSTIEPLRKNLEVVVTGTLPFSAETEIFLTEGFGKLLLLVIATILVSYYLGFQSKRAVFLPITIVISGTIFSLGIMVLAGFKLSMVSIISPPLVLTLGSSYSIHVMNAYYNLSKYSNEPKVDIIAKSVTGISGTVILASFTTLIGLMSLMLATIRQTREFAMITSLGIFFTAILSITLLPAFLTLQPAPEKKKLRILDKDPLSKFLNHFGARIVNWKIQAIILIILILATFIILMPRVSFNTSPSKYFPKSSNLIIDHKIFLEKIGGFEELKIELKGPEEGYFLKPEVLSSMYELEQKLIELPNISYIFSFPRYLNFAGTVMTGKEGNFQSRGLNLLVSRIFGTVIKDETIANKDYSNISISIRTFNREKNLPIDEEDTVKLVQDLEEILSNNVESNIVWRINGMSLNFLQLSKQMRRDFLVSTLAALFFIGIIASISFKSIAKGLLALIPLLTGIFTSLILMAIFRIPLDMTTIMVSCISIGVGVDDSIHFLLQYQKQSIKNPTNNRNAILETLKHAGRPIAITTLSIVAGLLFLSFAQFQPIRYFGLLIVFTLSTACLATLIILPPLLKSTPKMKI
ncbi:MAG: MMPL family transporter [Spirochaetia bacterium]|jgi:hydrophobe/amphiphile efflux-3 (HAE3) family protein|nr:MMPL family transporter [Spirochaetia bacterium]